MKKITAAVLAYLLLVTACAGAFADQKVLCQTTSVFSRLKSSVTARYSSYETDTPTI